MDQRFFATILIVARNAANTIERALVSACDQGRHAILLVDDFSDDDTVVRAKGIAGDRLQVVQPARHSTLGLARQTGLMAMKTPYGVWLDADDQLLPGRMEMILEAMINTGADLASDEAELFDGLTERLLKPLKIPSFFRGYHPLARLFERNYLPAPGAVGFRAEFARKIGYDPNLNGVEDFDFLLCAIAANARLELLENTGYRVYAYPGSLSRNIDNQRHMYRCALAKHEYEDVRNLYLRAGYRDQVACWGLISMAMYREDYSSVLGFLNELEMKTEDVTEVLEPDGPWPYAEQWRMDFFRATALLLLDMPGEAIERLERLAEGLPSPAVYNNLGVARWKTGDEMGAIRLFECSLKLFPGYFDAKCNLESGMPNRITSHPLRLESARLDYV